MDVRPDKPQSYGDINGKPSVLDHASHSHRVKTGYTNTILLEVTKKYSGNNKTRRQLFSVYFFAMYVNLSEWKAARDLQQRPSYLVVVETIALGLIFVTSTTGNILSCVIMYRSPRLRTWHNLLLLNVIFVDLLATILCVPFAFVVLLTGKWSGG